MPTTTIAELLAKLRERTTVIDTQNSYMRRAGADRQLLAWQLADDHVIITNAVADILTLLDEQELQL